MKFSLTGFTGNGVLEFSPASDQSYISGIFGGRVRSSSPTSINSYGLNLTNQPPASNLEGIEAIDFNLKNPYFYGKKNQSTEYFSGDFTTPSSDLYEFCHGIRKAGAELRNFYLAYYRYGFFEPPWGTNPTRTAILMNFQQKEEEIVKSLADSDINNAENFANGFNISLNEYHQLNGITPVNCGGKPAARCNPTTAQVEHFRYLYYECPQDIASKSPSYQEAELKWIPGDGIQRNSVFGPTYLVAGGLYNNSPIPTIFDIEGDYKKKDVCGAESRKNVYSSETCKALDLEGELSILRGDNNLMASYTANAVAGFGFGGLGGNGKGGYVAGDGAGAQDIGNEDFWYWHFVHKENAETFPFNNNPDPRMEDQSSRDVTNSDGSVSTVTTYKAKGNNQAIQTFVAKIAQESWYWKHRTCPDFPDFLPWNWGASIFAYPETYFEVPYYSALGKFGFYGTRFLNTIGTLVDSEGNVETGCGVSGTPFLNTIAGARGDSYYDRLLEVAALQRKYNDYYAGNKGLFLALNLNFMMADGGYASLNSATKSGLLRLHDVFWKDLDYSGMGHPNLLSAWIYDKPQLKSDEGFIYIDTEAEAGQSIGSKVYYHTGYRRAAIPESYLYTNELYERHMPSTLPNSDSEFINKYCKYIVGNTGGAINTGTYFQMSSTQKLVSERRSVGHEVNGMPVDLFPLNRIYYSTDNSLSYTNGWTPAEKLNINNLPSIPRNYFEGYYSVPSGDFPSFAGLTTFSDNDVPYGFNAGFFHAQNQGKMLPTRYFKSSKSGEMMHNKKLGTTFQYTGLSLLGYNEIGKLDGGFSCFSPIFIQQPTSVFCKIGQAPTFRALAVDYHTLPEDKIKGNRWPEITYWAKKLKLVDSKGKNLYPLKYKWGRIPISERNNYNIGQLSGVQWADKTGDWCGLEADGSSIFTLIHPKECRPVLTGYNGVSNIGGANNFASYIQGCKKGIDDQYLYFSMVSGRFGIRRSELAELVIDDSLKFDIAFKNASPQSLKPKLVLHSFDKNNAETIVIVKGSSVGPYYGYRADPNAIPETAISERRTPSAVGCLPSWSPCCDEDKKRVMGAVGYGSFTYTWQPPNIQDVPLLNINWGQVLHYGGLVPFSKKLSQREGDAIYGRVHLPSASSGVLIAGYQGVPFDLYLDNQTKVSHWSVDEPAWATDNSKEGIPFRRGDIISSLYPPSEGSRRYRAYPFESEDQTYGKGHWQFSNNLGLIKRLSYLDFVGKNATWDGKDSNGTPLISFSYTLKDKAKLLDSIQASLRIYPGGPTGGWRRSSLGRHMAYFIEGFDSFYLFCGNKKKEFVKNLSFSAPGLRVGNAGFQYFWGGQPHSSYLTRETLPGPYAYFWKFNRNNRDRNGNGMPLGMYSYATDSAYTDASDLPSIYGLYMKSNRQDSNQGVINRIKYYRSISNGQAASYVRQGGNIWNRRFEFNSAKGISAPDETRWCGTPFGESGMACSGYNPVGDTRREYCSYPNDIIHLASNPDLDIYDCPVQGIKAGACFPPCLSIRYDQGLIPGGKALNLLGDSRSNQPVNIIGDASFDGSVAKGKSLGPTFTPWASVLSSILPPQLQSSIKKYQSIDPRYGGGSDHCNYVTPTAWLGSTQRGLSNVNYLDNLIKKFS